MSGPRKVLFVCTGNICRSAMAEHLLRHLAKTRGLDIETRSCGVAAESYYEVPAVVRRLLAEKGVPAFEHTARLATREHLRWADTILVMTERHFDSLVDRFPEFTGKVRLFREAAGFGAVDVEDPMGEPDEVFTRCLGEIEESLEALLKSGFGASAA